MTVLINGRPVEAIVDTGSGLNQIACNGAAIQSNKVENFDPNASPALDVLSADSALCKSVCQNPSARCENSTLMPEGCAYYTRYGDGSWLHGFVARSNLSFPAPVTLPTPSVDDFLVGCAYNSSYYPYFFQYTNGLFGIDWEPTSMWQQLVNAGAVGNSMYLCLGNGWGDTTTGIDRLGRDQRGVIVFGYDGAVSVTGASSDGETLTIPMLDPKELALVPPSSWIKVFGVRVGTSKAPLHQSEGGVYLIDSGSSGTYLTRGDYEAFNSVFCPSVISAYPSANCSFLSLYYAIDLPNNLTDAEIDATFPTINFLVNSSSPITLIPSVYMNLQSYRDGVNHYQVSISPRSGTGVLGNSFMADWLIQQMPDTLTLKMTRVKSCADVTYTGSSEVTPPPIPAPQPTKPLVYKASLIGASAVPPVSSKATGSVSITLVNRSYASGYYYATNVNQMTMAHLHLGAMGKNGPVIAWAFNATYGPISGSVKALFSFNPSVNNVSGLLAAGLVYFNVHTTSHPAGELRGQL